jgi:ribosomal protein S6--L-glutamate ligase
VKLGLILKRHPPGRVSPIMPRVAELLGDWGAEVDVIYPEEELTALDALLPSHDLYVLKSGSDLALSLAGALDKAGGVVLNPYSTSAVCRDKVVCSRALREAGIPTPETYVTAEPAELGPLLDEGPLVIKPHRGSQGRGVRVVEDRAELEHLPAGEEIIFAQRYHEPDGRDLKIYCIGEQVFGVRRKWPARTYEDKLGEPFSLSAELRLIALRCGEAMGLELFGFDVVMSGGRPYVVDFSSFPGFKGVPDAPLRIADYIYAAAQRVERGERLLPEAEVAVS